MASFAKLPASLQGRRVSSVAEQDKLYSVVYEREGSAQGSVATHLWTYRDRITLDHLTQTLQQQNMKETCPILYEFLQQEHNLRATKYLADIVRLQKLLCDRYHHRLDRREAKDITIRQFLEDVIKSEEVRSDYGVMFSSVRKAWTLVREQLRLHGRLKIDDEYLLEAIAEDTPLEYLIPTPNGAGACSMALADFLMLTHNSFIERCRSIVAERENRHSSQKEKKVPLRQIHRCHLLDYESQLLSIVLSHCHYSLTIGKGQKISYNLPALEKHIMDRFIHGKPLILSDIPQVVYRRDVYNASTFADIRSKVSPQIPLEPHVKKEIIMELRSPDHLRRNLDVVEIVLGFLSSGGGKADRSLGEYVERTLKMKGRFCEKGKEHCKLGHVLSLWQTLATELAKKIASTGQEPFDLNQEFLEKLARDGEEDQVEALGTCLRTFDLEWLLETLCEFIETDLKYSTADHKDWTLQVVMEEFCNRYNIPKVPGFSESFPKSITLAQTAAAWKYIAIYSQEQKAGRVDA